MRTSRPVLPLSTATALSSGAAATWGPAVPPERRPLVPSHLVRLHDPVASEFRRTESSFPDLRSQRVGGDPKFGGGFPEGQKGHSAASFGLCRSVLQLRWQVPFVNTRPALIARPRRATPTTAIGCSDWPGAGQGSVRCSGSELGTTRRPDARPA